MVSDFKYILFYVLVNQMIGVVITWVKSERVRVNCCLGCFGVISHPLKYSLFALMGTFSHNET